MTAVRTANIAAPLVIAFAVLAGGCAARSAHVQDLTKIDDCWKETERVRIRGEGDKAKVVGREVVIPPQYDQTCADAKVAREQQQSDAAIAAARIDAESKVLTELVIAKGLTPQRKIQAFRDIATRLEDPSLKTSQEAANKKAGLSEDFIRAQLEAPAEEPGCRTITTVNNILFWDCK